MNHAEMNAYLNNELERYKKAIKIIESRKK